MKYSTGDNSMPSARGMIDTEVNVLGCVLATSNSMVVTSLSIVRGWVW